MNAGRATEVNMKRLGWVLFLVIVIGSALATVAQETPVVPHLSDAPPAAQPIVCPNVPPNRMIVYERGRVTMDDPAPLNLRSGPRTTFDVLDQIPSGGIFFVLEGPRCSDQYAWYRVDYRGQQGWVAEGSSNAYFIELYLPG